MNPTAPTVVRHSRWWYVSFWTAFPTAGAVLGLLASWVPAWIAGLPWAPYQEVLARLAEVGGPRVTIGLVLAGVLAGGALALMAHNHDVMVTVTNGTVDLCRRGTAIRTAGVEVAGVFVDGKQLVLLGHRRQELARERTDLGSGALQAAFEPHGYRWHADDPYEQDFERWVDGIPALGAHANAILRARQEALERNDESDARELRVEAARLGVVVRDRNGRQQWRLTDVVPS